MHQPTPTRPGRLRSLAIAAGVCLCGSAWAGPPESPEGGVRPGVRVSLPSGSRVVRLPGFLGRHAASLAPARQHDARPGAGDPPRTGPSRAGKGGGTSKAEGGGFEWTPIEPSADSRLVYVSTSDGHDSKSGLSPDDPVRTLAKGISLLRDGFPDHLLLKRGDVWEDEAFGCLKQSGRSVAEPLVIASYGESTKRPLVLTGQEKRGLRLGCGQFLEHVRIVGLELHAHTNDGEGGAQAGIVLVGGGDDILVEDCKIHGYKDNLVFNGFGQDLTDLRIRGCVIADSFSKIAHAQGMYAAEVDGILIEGCVFDHNGWSESIPGADPTIFNHNIYIQTNCSDVTVRESLIMNASSHGVQLRPGGVCRDNVFLFNAIGVLAGNAGDAPPVKVAIRGNVIMHGDDITPEMPRGMGIDLQHVSSGSVDGNVLARNESSKPYGHAIKLNSGPDSPVENLRIARNTIHDWQGGLKFAEDGLTNVQVAMNRVQSEDQSVPIVRHEGALESVDVRYRDNVYHSEAVPVSWFQVGANTYNFGAWKEMASDSGSAAVDLSFQEATRTVETYQASLGGEPGLDAFIEAVRDQSRLEWNEDYAVPAILAYLREGFGVEGNLGQAASHVGQ